MKNFKLIFLIVLMAVNIFNTVYAGEEQDNIKYDEITYACKDFCYPVIIKKNNKYGIIDNGYGVYKTIVPVEYDLITKTPDFTNITYIVKKQNKYGIFLFNGFEQKIDVLLDNSYDDIKFINNALYFIVKKNNKYQLYNFNARKLYGNYDDVIQTRQGGDDYLIVKKDNKYGVIYIYGRFKGSEIKCEFDSIEELYKDYLFKLEKDGKYAIYNLQTKKSTGFIFDKKTTNIQRYGDYFIINDNGKYSLYVTNIWRSKFIIKNCDEISHLSHGWQVYKVKKGKKYALYKGKLSLFIYDDIQDGSDYYHVFVKKNNKWKEIPVARVERALGFFFNLLGIQAL